VRTLARISLAIEGLRQLLPLRPKKTDKSPRDVRPGFPWRLEILRAIVDTRCIPLCWRLSARSCAFPPLALSCPCSHPAKFQFHLVFLPAAYFLSDEEVGVIAEIARTVAIGR